MEGLSANLLPLRDLRKRKCTSHVLPCRYTDTEALSDMPGLGSVAQPRSAHVSPPSLAVRSPSLTLKSRFPVWGKEQPSLCCGSWTCFQSSILLQSWPFQRIWYALTFQFVSKYFFDWSSSTLTFADRIASFVCLWVLFCLLLTCKTLLQDRSSWGGNYVCVTSQWRTSTNSSSGT